MALNHISKVPLPCKITYSQFPMIRMWTFGVEGEEGWLGCIILFSIDISEHQKASIMTGEFLAALKMNSYSTCRVETKNMLSKQLVMANEPKELVKHLCLFWSCPSGKGLTSCETSHKHLGWTEHFPWISFIASQMCSFGQGQRLSCPSHEK